MLAAEYGKWHQSREINWKFGVWGMARSGYWYKITSIGIDTPNKLSQNIEEI